MPVENLPNEEWRVCDDYPNYAVSNMGRVKRILTKSGNKTDSLLKSFLWSKRILAVHTCNKGKHSIVRVADLVSKAFMLKPCDAIGVTTKNSNYSDCSVFNLKYTRVTDDSEIGEIWKICKNYPDYAVSNIGRVKRITNGRFTFAGYLLKLNMCKGNSFYPTVNLDKIKVYVHRLVAEEFLGDPGSLHVNHKDGNKQNNKVENLEYCTLEENVRHAHRMGFTNTKGLSHQQGERHGGCKITEEIAKSIKIIACSPNRNMTLKDIAKAFNTTQFIVANITYGQSWKWL